MTREEAIAQRMIAELGGHQNVAMLECCMTRVRVETRNPELVDQGALRQLEGVKGVLQTGTQVQVIFGPGLAQQIAELATSTRLPGQQAASALGQNVLAAEGFTSSILTNRIAAVFVPLLPAIIGAGMITALSNLLLRLGVINDSTSIGGYAVLGVLGVVGATIMSFLSVLVGMNAARQWGGPAAIGAVAGAILISPTLSTLSMTPGRGGLIGALIAGAFLGWLYRQVGRRMPAAIHMIATPLLTMLVGGVVVLFVIQPIGFEVSQWITRSTIWLLGVGGPIAGFLLSSLFLPLVMLGVHQGLTPIHLELIKQTGQTPLLPVLAMGGAGQVGAAFAVYLRTKDRDLKRIILAALPVGILGVGEPLIYGVTLPLFRPFVGACIGAGFGGAFISLMHMGAIAIGVSGVVLAFLVTSPMAYLLGLLVSYACGFAATWLLGFDESRVGESRVFTFGE